MCVVTCLPVDMMTSLGVGHVIRCLPVVAVVCWFFSVVSGQAQRVPLECRVTKKGAEYRGRISRTSSHRACEPWYSVASRRHVFDDVSLFPDRDLASAGSACRNPGGIRPRPWCFTRDPLVGWEYCDIPMCGCNHAKAGWDYSGAISLTVSGQSCQRWDKQTPHQHRYTNVSAFPDTRLSEAASNCRNPDPWETGGPWCYTQNPQNRWEYCHIPSCECLITDTGTEYGGRISRTRSGHKCQRWDRQTPHQHSFAHAYYFPEDTVSDAVNYCRNPDPTEYERPWCYTSNSEVVWEYCNIPMCEQEIRRTIRVNHPNVSEIIYIEVTPHDLAKHTVASASGVSISIGEYIFIAIYSLSAILLVITLSLAVLVLKKLVARAHQPTEQELKPAHAQEYPSARDVKREASPSSGDSRYIYEHARYVAHRAISEIQDLDTAAHCSKCVNDAASFKENENNDTVLYANCNTPRRHSYECILTTSKRSRHYHCDPEKKSTSGGSHIYENISSASADSFSQMHK